MGALIGALIVIVFAAFIAYFSKRRIEDTVFISFALISFTLYIFGMLGTLMAGVFMTGVAALVCLIVMAVHFSIDKNKVQLKVKTLSEYVFTPGLAVFVFLALFFVVLNYGREYYLNDEFSHWGLSIKNMFALDKLHCVPESSDTFKDYPPFASLICYFWSAVTGSFNESYTFTGMGLLMFSCLLPFFKRFSFKEKKTLILLPAALTLCFLFTISFKLSAFTILAVDTLIALISVYVFLLYFDMRHAGNKKDMISGIVFIAVAVAALALTKSIAIGFCIFAVILIAVDTLFFEKKRSVWMKLSVVFVPTVSFVLANVSWNAVLKFSDFVAEESGVSTTLKNLYQMIFNTDTLIPYRKQTVDSFIDAAFEGRFAFGISLFVIFIILLLCSAFLIIAVRKDRKKVVRYSVITLLQIVGLILYLKAILYTYVYKFTEYEAVTLASYERYIGTFLTFWLLVIAVLYFVEFYEKFNKAVASPQNKAGVRIKKVMSVASVLSMGLIVIFYLVFYPYSASFSVKQRMDTNHASQIGDMYDTMKQQNSYVDANDIAICYITTLTDNRDFLIANYNAAPFTLSFDTAWYNNLDLYDYLYVDSIDEKDKTAFAALNSDIEKKDDLCKKLYRVVSQGDSYAIVPVAVP